MSDIWDLWDEPEEPVAPIVKYNSNTLANYFQRQFSQVAWSSGFTGINHAALRGAFAKWKKAGATTEEVTAMIDAYMADPKLRGSNPGWQDFLYHREQIRLSLASTGPVDEWAVLEEEDIDE